MPVMGHAFAGLATAALVRPGRVSSAAPVFWAPALLLLAYLPDIAAQVVQVLGLGTWVPVCHSIVLAVPVALLVAVLLRRLLLVPWRACLPVAFAGIVLHDLLDVLVGHRRQLWWPILDRPLSLTATEAELSMASEVLLFGGPLLALLAIRWLWGWCGDRSATELMQDRFDSARAWRQVWVAGGVTAIVLLAVAATQHLRDLREWQLDLAWTMIGQRQSALALKLLDQAERWPSTARPGQIDYARAEAYADMGERVLAEQCYLRSYRADPSYFWAVADLAAFYASSEEPLDVRRRRAAPYLGRLTSEFTNEPALPRYLAKLQRRLSDPPSTQAARSG